jgi:polar amino acid transport system permease protein
MIDWAYIIEIMPDLLEATLITIRLALSGYLLAMFIGLFFALARMSGNTTVSRTVWVISESIRLTPLLVQLFFVFFVLPEFGIMFSAEITGVFVIGLHYATYISEVYRSGIRAIPSGQWEAAIALDLPTGVFWRRIVLPQSVRPMLPALGNYLIQLLKEVPILSTITVYELLNTANLLAGSSFKYLEALTMVGVIFLILSLVISFVFRKIEASNANS